MSKRILLIGGGGHCKSVLDSLLVLKQYIDIGIIDKKENIGKKIMGISIIGCDDDLSQLYKNGYSYAFVTVGSIGHPHLRIKLFDLISAIGFVIPNVIDQSAVVSDDVFMDSGIFIGKNAVVNAGSKIRKGSIINSGAIIEHDCLIGSFAHIAPGTVLCGEVEIGKNTHIGAKSVVRQQLKMGANSIIGIGSVVTKSLADKVVAYGNPCKVARVI